MGRSGSRVVEPARIHTLSCVRSSEPARPPTPAEVNAYKRRRLRARMETTSQVAWMVLSWLAVVAMAVLVVLLVLTIGLCAGWG